VHSPNPSWECSPDAIFVFQERAVQGIAVQESAAPVTADCARGTHNTRMRGNVEQRVRLLPTSWTDAVYGSRFRIRKLHWFIHSVQRGRSRQFLSTLVQRLGTQQSRQEPPAASALHWPQLHHYTSYRSMEETYEPPSSPKNEAMRALGPHLICHALGTEAQHAYIGMQ
jgi:hypothetical protein